MGAVRRPDKWYIEHLVGQRSPRLAALMALWWRVAALSHAGQGDASRTEPGGRVIES